MVGVECDLASQHLTSFCYTEQRIRENAEAKDKEMTVALEKSSKDAARVLEAAGGAGERRRMPRGNSGARGRRSALVGARKKKKRPRRRASAKRRRRPAQQNVQSNSSTRTKSWLRK
jgi:hypothetical protein